MSDTKYFGIYRGTVVNNVDPMQHGPAHASWCPMSAA